MTVKKTINQMEKSREKNGVMGYEAILLAAGHGERMQHDQNKVLLDLVGQPVILYSLNVFLQDPNCKHIIIVVQEKEKELFTHLAEKEQNDFGCTITITSGGKERQQSVFCGLQAMENTKNIVMIHDGARPFVQLEQIELLYKRVLVTRAAILGVPVKDTIKRVESGIVEETIARETLWQVQTPQAFYGWELEQAHRFAQEENFLGTDDASLIEKFTKLSVSIVKGNYNNIKLTTPEDMLVAELFIKRK